MLSTKKSILCKNYTMRLNNDKILGKNPKMLSKNYPSTHVVSPVFTQIWVKTTQQFLECMTESH